MLDVGTSATLNLYLDAVAFFQGAVVMQDLSIVTDIDTGEIVKWTGEAVVNGAWTNAGAGEVADLPAGEETDPQEAEAASESVKQMVAEHVAAVLPAVAQQAAEAAILAFVRRQQASETPTAQAA